MTDRPTAFPPPTSEAPRSARFDRATRAMFLAFISVLVAALRHDPKDKQVPNPQNSQNAANNGEVKIEKPRLSSPGKPERTGRTRQFFNALVEEARRDRRANGLPPDEEACIKEAEKKLRQRQAWRKRLAGDNVSFRVPYSRITDYNDIVLERALNDHPIGRRLDALLRTPATSVGRPSNHAHARATLKKLLWTDALSIRECHGAFEKYDDRQSEFIYGMTADQVISYGAVCEAISGSLRPDGSRYGLVNRIPLTFIDEAFVEIAEQLEPLVDEEFDKAAAIDGTLIQAAVQQRKGFSPEDEEDIDRGRGTDVVSRNQGKTWIRGYLAVTVTLTSCNIPIAIEVYPASKSEPTTIVPIWEKLHENWKDASIKYLVGDSAFERNWKNHHRLQTGFGTMIVAPRFSPEAVPAHLQGAGFDGRGNPVCNCNNTQKLMIRTKTESVWDPNMRHDKGLMPGEDSTKPAARKGRKPRLIYGCPAEGCNNTYTLTLNKVIAGGKPNQRWGAVLPHTEEVHPKLYATRRDLYSARNMAESAFANLKRKGVDSSPAMAPQFLNTEHFAHLWIKTKVLKFALLRLMELDGTLARVEQDCVRAGLHVPRGNTRRELDIRAA